MLNNKKICWLSLILSITLNIYASAIEDSMPDQTAAISTTTTIDNNNTDVMATIRNEIIQEFKRCRPKTFIYASTQYTPTLEALITAEAKKNKVNFCEIMISNGFFDYEAVTWQYFLSVGLELNWRLIKMLTYTEFRALLTHELAHVHLDHIASNKYTHRNLNYAYWSILGATQISLFFDQKNSALSKLSKLAIVSLAASYLVKLYYYSENRQHEFEADAESCKNIGLEPTRTLLEKVDRNSVAMDVEFKCFAPLLYAESKFLEVLGFSTHPSTEKRIQHVTYIFEELNQLNLAQPEE